MIKHTMLYPHNLIFLLKLFSVVFNDIVIYVYAHMCNNLKDYSTYIIGKYEHITFILSIILNIKIININYIGRELQKY